MPGAVSGGLAGFMQFIREQGVVGLATGFILGGAVSKTVTALVNDIVNPLIGMVLGSTEGLKAMKVGPIMLGDFVSVTIDFVIIAAVVYFVVKGLGLDKLDKAKA
ncbi:MscL family protein [bacterium]|nr:MscL family protein [bacterium]